MLQRTLKVADMKIQNFIIENNMMYVINSAGAMFKLNVEKENIDFSKIAKKFITKEVIIEITNFGEDSFLLVEDQGKIHLVRKGDCKVFKIKNISKCLP